jgi:NitT/TauT family transport system substrate-binding protein
MESRFVMKVVGICAGLIGCTVVAAVLLTQYQADSAAIGQDTSQSLRLGTNVWTGYEPLYLARSLGHYDERSVRLVEYSSASQVIRAFRNNTVEVAALTLDEVLLLKESGYDVRVILVVDFSHGGDVLLGNPEITQLADLRGRSIGVEHTALGAYVLTRALQSMDMSVADVNVVPLEVDEHERAFAEGKVDAVVTFEPIRSRLMAKGAVRLFDSTQIPGEIVDVLAVRGDIVDSQSESLNILLRGWFLALQHLQEHPEDASRHMGDRLKLEPPDVLASFAGLQFPDVDENIALLAGDQPTLAATAGRLADLMLAQKLLENEIDVSQLFSAELVKRLKDK